MVVFLVFGCWGGANAGGSWLHRLPFSPNRNDHRITGPLARCSAHVSVVVLLLLLLLVSAAAAATTPTPAWTRSEDPAPDAEESCWLDEMEDMCRTPDLRAGDLEARQYPPSEEPQSHHHHHHQYLPDHLAAVTEFSSSGGGLLWHDLSVSSGAANILQPFSFHIGNGQLVGLLGPSGSGK